MASLLENKITTMKSKYEHQLEITKDSSQKECENLEAKIEELEKQLQAESHARRLLETQILQEKRENEAQMRDALSQVLILFYQIHYS